MKPLFALCDIVVLNACITSSHQKSSYAVRSLVCEKATLGKTRISCEGIQVDDYDGAGLAIERKEQSTIIYCLRHDQAGHDIS